MDGIDLNEHSQDFPLLLSNDLSNHENPESTIELFFIQQVAYLACINSGKMLRSLSKVDQSKIQTRSFTVILKNSVFNITEIS